MQVHDGLSHNAPSQERPKIQNPDRYLAGQGSSVVIVAGARNMDYRRIDIGNSMIAVHLSCWKDNALAGRPSGGTLSKIPANA